MSTKQKSPLTGYASTPGARLRGAALAAFGLLALLAAGPAAAASVLKEIGYTTLDGNQVRVELRFDGGAPEPRSFSIEDPARVVVDLPDTRLGLERRRRTIGVGAARSVTAVEGGDRSRVAINLARMVPHELRSEGDTVHILLESGGAGTKTAAAAAQGDATGGVKAVDFRRGERGEGRVVVTLADPSTAVDMQTRGDDIVVDFRAASLPEKLERRLDVTDFATPVKTVDTFARDGNVRVVIGTVSDFEHLAYQAGKTFTVEVQPKADAEEADGEAEKEEYTGERLSLNFQSIEVRAVLQLLADFTGMNLVVSDTVGGNITLRLKNVPWDQALDIILTTKGLGMRKQGNVMLVAPAEEIAAREKQQLEAEQQIKELAPLRSESIQVNYAKASEVATLLKSEENSLISERGSVTIDGRTNKLLVRDTAENIEQVRDLVEELDVPVRQVLIESRVVLATDDFSHELGARFGVSKGYDDDTLGDGTETGVSGDSASASTIAVDGGVPTQPGRFNVDLPVTNLASSAGSIGLAIAKLPLGTILDLELSAAQAEGRSETISTPRVITANQQEATIEQGAEIPYQEAAGDGATNVSFKKAVLSLNVTPQITPDDKIIMDLQVNKDSPDFANSVQGQPPINTQSVQTRVLVANGETLVLGGVYERDKAKQLNRVPFFGDLPVLGHLFRSKFQQDNKSELLIFVTPKIVNESASLQ